MDKDFLVSETRCDFLVSEKRKKIWHIELDLLKQLDRVCKKYQLRYFASNGTLLGAIRHQGFVPWDDDVDIVMPRPDYNRLLELAPEEFKEPYYLHVSAEDHSYYRNYARLRNRHTTAMPFRDWNRRCCNGIFIDIFPIDGCSRNSLVNIFRKIQIRVFSALSNTYVYYPDFSKYMFLRRITYVIAKVYCSLSTYPQLLKKVEQIRSKTPYESADMVYVITHGNHFYKFPKAYYEETIWMDFEYIKLPIPGSYDAILKSHYGNYSEFPPREERGQHHEIFFDPDISYTGYTGQMTKEEAKKLLNDY